MVGIGLPEFSILLAVAVFWIVTAWMLSKVFERTGMNPALSLLIFVPYVGVFIVLYLLGFSPWPVLELRALSIPAPPNPTDQQAEI